MRLILLERARPTVRRVTAHYYRHIQLKTRRPTCEHTLAAESYDLPLTALRGRNRATTSLLRGEPTERATDAKSKLPCRQHPTYTVSRSSAERRRSSFCGSSAQVIRAHRCVDWHMRTLNDTPLPAGRSRSETLTEHRRRVERDGPFELSSSRLRPPRASGPATQQLKRRPRVQNPLFRARHVTAHCMGSTQQTPPATTGLDRPKSLSRSRPTQPAIQIHSGHFLKGGARRRGGKAYRQVRPACAWQTSQHIPRTARTIQNFRPHVRRHGEHVPTAHTVHPRITTHRLNDPHLRGETP
jgi:hypothetical protein